MSKACLVMDMPESCSKCMFLYEFSGIKNCNLMNVMYGGASRLSQENFTKCRHEKCPLRPIPEKKKEDNSIVQYSREEVFAYQKGWNAGRIVGFNACIDAIGGGDGE